MKVYVGHDSREDIAYQVCEHSIKRRDPSAEVIPLKQKQMRDSGLYTRPVDKLASTEFTFTRFFVPYLNDFKGWAVFCDCDFLWKIPSHELVKYCDPSKAVVVVQHDYTPKETTKMDGQTQTVYPRKNWSSFIVWNCAHASNKSVDPKFIGDADAATLHRFLWLKDEEIGELSTKWNWLVGEYDKPTDDVNVLHWTLGGPYFEEYSDTEFSSEWKKEFESMTYCKQLQ